MNYKTFRLNIAARLGFIFLSMTCLIILFQKGSFFATCAGLVFFIGVQAWLLLKYIEKTHRDLNYFFEATITDDFTSHTPKHFNTSTGQELHNKFSRIQQQFLQLRHKNEELVRYYSLLLEKVPVAILIVDGKKMALANSAAQKLFQRNRLEYTDYLNQFGEQLALDVQQISPGQQRTSQMILHETTISLALSAASIQLSDGVKKIVSLNPIQRELDEQEMAAWQNLVQVFTHEIMNSMTPVASLSKTASDLLTSAKSSAANEHDEMLADAHQAINIVARRAENLMGFVQAYRRIANPPVIQYEKINLQLLFAEVCQLLNDQARVKNITLNYIVTPENLILDGDLMQIEQALINLLKNAVEAIARSEGGAITLEAYIGEGGNIIVEVIDNGCGIPNDKLEQIFVPFYTSKREGTGIGLFLVKQIMQAHMGSVYAAQTYQGGTLIRLVF
ncbi:MAG: GHKL domain-containing protein [Gammaproteobacteria bacterium]|nr:MAG: GHKL domain-containing protein [Gammaproteobacteria bacterium]